MGVLAGFQLGPDGVQIFLKHGFELAQLPEMVFGQGKLVVGQPLLAQQNHFCIVGPVKSGVGLYEGKQRTTRKMWNAHKIIVYRQEI